MIIALHASMVLEGYPSYMVLMNDPWRPVCNPTPCFPGFGPNSSPTRNLHIKVTQSLHCPYEHICATHTTDVSLHTCLLSCRMVVQRTTEFPTMRVVIPAAETALRTTIRRYEVVTELPREFTNGRRKIASKSRSWGSENVSTCSFVIKVGHERRIAELGIFTLLWTNSIFGVSSWPRANSCMHPCSRMV